MEPIHTAALPARQHPFINPSRPARPRTERFHVVRSLVTPNLTTGGERWLP